MTFCVYVTHVKKQTVSSLTNWRCLLTSQDVESWRKEFSSGAGEGSALWTENLQQWAFKRCGSSVLHNCSTFDMTPKRMRFTFLIHVSGVIMHDSSR